MKISIGMFTVYDAMQKDLDNTIGKLAAMGYDGIEMFGEIPCPAEELRAILDKYHIEISGWHVEWRYLQPNTIADTLAYHKTLKNPYIVIPALGGPWNIAHTQEEDCAEIWHEHTKAINRVIETAEAAGFKVGYHTHAHEFENRYDNGETPYSILLENCPKLIMELDTGNCIEGGEDPVKALRQAGKAAELLHIKPFSHKNLFNEVLGSETDLTPLDAVMETAKALGTEWVLAECEPDEGADNFALAEGCVKLLKSKI